MGLKRNHNGNFMISRRVPFMPRAPQGTRKGKGGGFWPFPGRFPNVQNADAWNAFHERSERVLFAVRASLVGRVLPSHIKVKA